MQSGVLGKEKEVHYALLFLEHDPSCSVKAELKFIYPQKRFEFAALVSHFSSLTRTALKASLHFCFLFPGSYASFLHLSFNAEMTHISVQTSGLNTDYSSDYSAVQKLRESHTCGGGVHLKRRRVLVMQDSDLELNVTFPT